MDGSTVQGDFEECLFGIARKMCCSVEFAFFIDIRLLCLNSVHVVPNPVVSFGKDLEEMNINIPMSYGPLRPPRDALEFHPCPNV